MAGSGIRGGTTCDAADQFAFHAVHEVLSTLFSREFQPTRLRCLGIDDHGLAHRHQDTVRLTDVAPDNIQPILSCWQVP